MKRSSLTLVLYLSLVFVSGLFVGALGHRLYTSESTAKAARSEHHKLSPSEWRARYTAMMEKRLALSGDQMRQLNLILDQTKELYEALERESKEASRPRKREIREQQTNAIFAILTPEQQSEYQKIREEHAERRRKAAERDKKADKDHK